MSLAKKEKEEEGVKVVLSPPFTFLFRALTETNAKQARFRQAAQELSKRYSRL